MSLVPSRSNSPAKVYSPAVRTPPNPGLCHHPRQSITFPSPPPFCFLSEVVAANLVPATVPSRSHWPGRRMRGLRSRQRPPCARWRHKRTGYQLRSWRSGGTPRRRGRLAGRSRSWDSPGMACPLCIVWTAYSLMFAPAIFMYELQNNE